MAQYVEDTRRSGGPGGSGGGGGAPAGARLLPHNLEAEESLLGAMLLSREAIAAAVERCTSENFYKPAHGHIFEAIISLYGRGEPADPVTVAEELRRDGLLDMIGGSGALVGLQAGTPTTSNAGHYARIVEEHALLRRLIGVANDIAEIGYSLPDDVTDAVDRAESLMFQVAERRTADTMASVRDLLSLSLDRLEMLYERGETITGVQSGYLDLDEQLNGLQPNALYIVGARPAMGKSAFALGMASNVALDQRQPVLFFSLEMGHLELTQRLLCGEARVDSVRMRNGRLHADDWPKITHAVGRLAEAPIFIDDNPHLTIMEIRGKARRLKSRLGELGLIVIDYLQLMTGRSNAENRQVEVAEISRGLKILARELEVPVVALSQLSRNLEQRADKRPMLSDLRESGCLPASTKVLRADNGEEVSLGQLLLSQEQPLVWSVDDHQRLVPARLLKTFPSGIKPVFRLRLASGLQVDATANHPFLTVDGWTRLDALERGSFVAVPRRVPAPVAVPAPGWSDDELVLLAHLLGDGSIGPSVKYATADPANRAAAEGAARRLFGITAQASRPAGKRCWQVWLPAPYRVTHTRHHPVRSWLEPHGLWGSRSHDKFVPESIFGLPDDKLCLFLRHLWATDGSITIGRNGRGELVRTYYATTSPRLAYDVHRLLLRLGIRARIAVARKAGYREGYHVRIMGAANQRRFLTDVGCHGERGRCIPEALRILEGVKENPNVDLVPQPIAARVRVALHEAGMTHRQLAEGLGEDYCGSYLLGTQERPRRFSRDRLRRIGEITRSSELVDVATSDLFWDEVVEVTPLGEQPVFDATIDGTHNFIADGVVVHNSLEQDADVVMFLYRDEVYHPDSADRGTAEVIVAKHRNGPVGTTRLAFLDHYTKFANMARGV